MNDDLMLFDGLDQPIPDKADQDFWMEQVENVLDEIFQDKDLERALRVCSTLIRMAGVTGKALAKILYTLEQHWDIFETDESFEDAIFRSTGRHKHTIERYVRVQAMFEDGVVPKEFEELIKQRTMGELIPIANAIARGHQFDDEEWKKLADAPDYSSIQKEVRESEGKPPRKSGLMIMMDIRGSLWAMNNEDRKFIGSLEYTSDEPIVKKAINRIIDNAGVMRQ